MPGKMIAQRFDPPSELAFSTTEHMVGEILIVRLTNIALFTQVINIQLDRIPDAIQAAHPWVPRLRQNIIELGKPISSMIHRLRNFSSHTFHAQRSRWSPFDAAAWDRYFALLVQTVTPDMPELEVCIRQLDELISTVPVPPGDQSLEKILDELEGTLKYNRTSLRVLQHLLTEDGLEADYAANLRGESLDFSEI